MIAARGSWVQAALRGRGGAASFGVRKGAAELSEPMAALVSTSISLRLSLLPSEARQTEYRSEGLTSTPRLLTSTAGLLTTSSSVLAAGKRSS